MNRGLWIVKFIVFGIVALGLMGLVTQTLWNWLVPELFSGPVLSFWQALGLLALSKILFWSFGRGGGHWKRQGRYWGPYWAEKMKTMSPEERERLKQKMWEKWCSPRSSQPENESGSANG